MFPMNDKIYRINIFDLSNEEVADHYIEQADIIILVCDLTDPKSPQSIS